jgi:hypothetical protein
MMLMKDASFSRTTINRKKMLVTNISPKNVLQVFSEFKKHPKESLLNSVNNFLTIDGLAKLTLSLSAEFLAGTLGVVSLLVSMAKAAIKEIKDIDSFSVLLSLVNTEYSSFGLNRDTLLEDVNILTNKEFGYSISMEKLNYILEQLINNFALVVEENNLIYLANEVEVK